MCNSKHICELAYCKNHGQCIFKNAESILKGDVHEVAIGNAVNANIVACYQKEDIGFEKSQIIKENKVREIVCKEFNKSFKIKSVRGLIPLQKININNSSNQLIRCANIYCGTSENLTRHHLIPKRYRVGIPNGGRTIFLCVDCHKRVHMLKRNSELASYFNTKQSIIQLLEEDKYFSTQRFIDVALNEVSMVA